MTNGSNINLLKSYKTLDMPDCEEADVVPQTLGNQTIKQNLGLKS